MADQDNNIYLKLLEKIAEQSEKNHETVVEIDKKLDLHIQRTQHELEKINLLDIQQNELIDQHIEGVRTLKNLLDQQKQSCHLRFDQIETPRKVFNLSIKFIKDLAIVTTAIVTALVTLGKLGLLRFLQ